ncbi:MAG: ethylbenzene dehydrogenase-related protein [Gammaproteobacteria bacterium]|nr:ethylbenzene dehydrogenase-related protein [Gammaproteobacteria bacterium]
MTTFVSVPVWAIDWNGVPVTDVTLFYPGQSSLEWAMTEDDHSGAKKFRAGKDCFECHDGEEKDIGAKIVSGKKLEPNPIAGKPGTLALKVQAAHDAERLYLRLSWTGGATSGTHMDPKYAERVTVMFDDGSVKEASRAGCWASCHDDAQGMASAPEGKKITKYLWGSRTKITRQGGGENFKADAELAQQLAGGQFLEFWQARLNPGQPAEAVQGYVLEKRQTISSPAVSAEASQQGNAWTVVFSRPLQSGGAGQKAIVAGTTYSVGFAVHDDYASHRFHHVSFGRTLVLDQGKADIVAVKK